MALTIIWSQESLDDIEAIAAFIHRDSPFYARTVAQKIITTAEAISQFPEVGRIVPELNQHSVRERFVYSYRIIYALQTTHIEILAVMHGKRLLNISQFSQ